MALKRIIDLDAAATLTGTELVELQQGSDSVHCTAQDIANLAPGGSPIWGSITGTLASQTDLQAALDAKASDRRTVTTLSIASGVVDIDCSLGDYFTLAITANVTSITFSNLPGSGKGASLAIRLQQDATGSRTVALPASFKAITGSDTAVQSAANARTVLMITTFDNGTRWEYSMKAGAA